MYDSQGKILTIHSSTFNVYVMGPDETFNDSTHYILGGVPTQRPVLPIPTSFTLEADGEECEIGTFPTFTRIFVDDVPQGQTNGSPTVFVPSSPGTVVLRAEPPFPYRPMTITITITELSA